MRYLNLSFSAPPWNLACDEALLDLCEDGYDTEILRLWESPVYFIALGYSNKKSSEVDVSSCQDRKIPILRRSSGGGTVLQGPGCLNYSLILKINGGRPITTLSDTNAYILDQTRKALDPLTGGGVSLEGTSDLAIHGKKFSGNAQRRKKNYVLFHGTVLIDFDLQLIEQVLKMPSRQPVYRRDRSHQDFLINLSVDREKVMMNLKKVWQADQDFSTVPSKEIERLVNSKYSEKNWNERF